MTFILTKKLHRLLVFKSTDSRLTESDDIKVLLGEEKKETHKYHSYALTC